MLYKKKFKNPVAPKKNWLLFEKQQFSSKLNSFQCWNKTLYLETPFYKKKYPGLLSFICHLGDLGTCFGGWAISILCMVIFYGFAQTGSNWFSAHPPSSQTLNQKIMLLLKISSLLYQIFLISFLWGWLPHWRTHKGSYMCEVEVAKIQYHNIENRNMPRFFQHWRLLPKLQPWQLLLIFL